MDTLATLYYLRGYIEQAVEWQMKAVELKPGDAYYSDKLKDWRKQSIEPRSNGTSYADRFPLMIDISIKNPITVKSSAVPIGPVVGIGGTASGSV